jgi:hypothetical protein
MVSGQYVQSKAVVRAFRVLTIAPTSLFADYDCHVRILDRHLLGEIDQIDTLPRAQQQCLTAYR